LTSTPTNVAVTAAPSVTIKVEAKSAKRIPVKVRPQDKFVGTVTFEPDSVVVEGPKDTLEGIKPENLVAYADLSDFASKPPGSYPPQDVTISLGSPTVDVTMKESVRAKLRTMVKRILRKYGYPPDKQEKATQTVLEQAELLCRDWAG